MLGVLCDLVLVRGMSMFLRQREVQCRWRERMNVARPAERRQEAEEWTFICSEANQLH